MLSMTVSQLWKMQSKNLLSLQLRSKCRLSSKMGMACIKGPGLALGGMTNNVYHCIWRYFFFMHNQMFTAFSAG